MKTERGKKYEDYSNVEHLFKDISWKYVVMDTLSVMWGTDQTNIFLVPSRGEEGIEGKSQGQGEDRDRETDRQTNKNEYINFTPPKSSYYHHISILIVMYLILHISDYGLVDHWSISDRLTISNQNVFHLVPIVRSLIDKWSIDSRSSSIDYSFILWLYRSEIWESNDDDDDCRIMILTKGPYHV